MIDIQLKIMFFKAELKKNPNDLASKVLLDMNRIKLQEMKK